MRLIDADELKDHIKIFNIGCGCSEDYQKSFLNAIDEQPTIEPEHKTGYWIPDNNNYYEERYICSACKRSYKVDTCMGKPMWDFCPCGAKMGEGERDA